MTLEGIVLGQREPLEGQGGVDALAHLFRQGKDREFLRVAEIDRSDLVTPHQPDQALHEIIHKAEAAGLQAISIEAEGLPAQGLNDEIAHHPSVVEEHARSVGVEDAGHPDLDAVHALIVEAQCFGDPFAFVVAGADADRIDRADIALGLGMDLGIPVDFAGAGQQQRCTDATGQAQHVEGAQKAGFGRVNRIVLVMHRRGRAGQVPDAIHLQADRFGHIVADEFKGRMVPPGAQVLFSSCECVVEADHVFAGLHQAIDEVGTNEASSTGDKIAHRPHGLRWSDRGGAGAIARRGQ